MHEGKKSEGGAFKAPPPGSYRVKLNYTIYAMTVKSGSKEESLLVVDPFGGKSKKYSSTHPQQLMF